ncbi:hypothetical protein Tco_0750878 [Tanacetum coccineum]|uniref:Uncharacterized protein n=1 Tax=Tanacetum coccineum TaxID=301880 RepID=A0ABQ4Z585_9ASTR
MFAKSFPEAEYRAMNTVTFKVIWIHKILSEPNIKISLPVPKHCDNNFAIQIAANPEFHEKTKHFKIKLFFLREKVSTGVVKTLKVKSANNVADIFTKVHVSKKTDAERQRAEDTKDWDVDSIYRSCLMQAVLEDEINQEFGNYYRKMYCNEPNDEYYEMAINQFDSSELRLRNESLINARIGKEAQCGCELTNVSDPSELDHRICLLRVLTHKANCFVAKGDMKSAHKAPELLKKVAQLLAILCALATDFDPLVGALSACQWSCFCHHLTLGSNLSSMYYSQLKEMYHASDPDAILHSLAPNLHDGDLKDFVIEYFKALPPHTIIGITILKDKYFGMLEMLLGESFMRFKNGAQYMMVSCFKSNGGPLVVLMPCLTEHCPSLVRGTGQHRRCPWGTKTIIDKIAPGFQMLSDYISLSFIPHGEYTEQDRLSFFAWKKNLDERVGNLLR